MCEAVTAALAVAATVASTAVSYMGSQASAKAAENQGIAARQQADYQAQVAANNAEAVRKQGEAAASEQQRQNSARLGQQRAVFAALGVDPNTGSALRIQEDTAEAGGLDVANIRHNALLQGMGFDQTATLQTAAGRNATAAGEAAASSAAMGGYGNLLAGAGQFSSRWNTFQQAGGFGGLSKGLGFGTPATA